MDEELPTWMNLRQLRTEPFTGRSGGHTWAARCTHPRGCTGFFTNSDDKPTVVRRATKHITDHHTGGSHA